MYEFFYTKTLAIKHLQHYIAKLTVGELKVALLCYFPS